MRFTPVDIFWAAFDGLWKLVAVLLVLYLLWLFGPFIDAAFHWSFGKSL